MSAASREPFWWPRSWSASSRVWSLARLPSGVSSSGKGDGMRTWCESCDPSQCGAQSVQAARLARGEASHVSWVSSLRLREGACDRPPAEKRTRGRVGLAVFSSAERLRATFRMAWCAEGSHVSRTRTSGAVCAAQQHASVICNQGLGVKAVSKVAGWLRAAQCGRSGARGGCQEREGAMDRVGAEDEIVVQPMQIARSPDRHARSHISHSRTLHTAQPQSGSCSHRFSRSTYARWLTR